MKDAKNSWQACDTWPSKLDIHHHPTGQQEHGQSLVPLQQRKVKAKEKTTVKAKEKEKVEKEKAKAKEAKEIGKAKEKAKEKAKVAAKVAKAITKAAKAAKVVKVITKAKEIPLPTQPQSNADIAAKLVTRSVNVEKKRKMAKGIPLLPTRIPSNADTAGKLATKSVNAETRNGTSKTRPNQKTTAAAVNPALIADAVKVTARSRNVGNTMKSYDVKTRRRLSDWDARILPKIANTNMCP